MWLVFKLQRDFAVFPSPLVFRSRRIYFLCKQSSQRSVRCLLILLGVTCFSAKWGWLTHAMELCCPVSSLQCCQILCSGSGSGMAFLFLWYLSSDILAPDLIKKTWKDNVFLVGAFPHNIHFLFMLASGHSSETVGRLVASPPQMIAFLKQTPPQTHLNLC